MDNNYEEIYVTAVDNEINNNNIEEGNPTFSYFDLKENKPFERAILEKGS